MAAWPAAANVGFASASKSFFMSITSEQITHIARLARLGTDAAEAEFYAGQLSRILELVEQMNRIDTGDIAPMSHPNEAALGLRLRDDHADGLEGPDGKARREEYQRIAPATEQGLYLTPRVVE